MHTSTHPRQRVHDKLKYSYHESLIVENTKFTGFTYRSMGKRLLIEEERTQRQQTTAEWLPAQKSWDSRAHCIVYTKLSRLENAPSANVLEVSHKKKTLSPSAKAFKYLPPLPCGLCYPCHATVSGAGASPQSPLHTVSVSVCLRC